MVGRVFEHFGLVSAHRFCTDVGAHFICQGNDGVAVFGGQFLEFEGVVGFGGWPGIHDLSFFGCASIRIYVISGHIPLIFSLSLEYEGKSSRRSAGL